MNWLRNSAITVLCVLVAGCSPSNNTDGGDAGGDAAVSSRCLTAVLPQCDRGPDGYSDEACFALDDAELRAAAVVDGARAPAITAPTAMQALPSATPFTFRWSAATALAPTRTPTRWNAVAHAAPLAPLSTPRAPTALEELARWTTLVPEAHAHCAPFSGIGYGLDFRVGARVILRVEQSTTEYTPGAAAWEVLRGAGAPIELRITAARFRNSTVSDGPFESPTRVTFTISP